MTSTAITTRQTYLDALKSSITEDLQRMISPEDLAKEIDKTLMKALLGQVADAAQNGNYYIVNGGDSNECLTREADLRRACELMLLKLDERHAARIRKQQATFEITSTKQDEQEF